MGFVAVFIIGVIMGWFISDHMTHSESVGDLRIDTSDPYDGPYMFLELHKDVSDIYKRKHVVLKVNTKNFISHK